MVAQDGSGNVGYLDVGIATVIKGYSVGKSSQLLFVLVLGYDATAVVANVVIPCLLLGCYLVRHFVRTPFASRHLDDENRLTISLLDEETWLIIRHYEIVEANHILLYRLNLIGIDSLDRTHSTAIHFLYAYHDVATASVLKVISEGADGAIDRVGIPALLVIKSVVLHSLPVEQVFYVDV